MSSCTSCHCWATTRIAECSVGNRSEDGSSLRTHGTFLLVCHSSYGLTINAGQAARRPYKIIHGGLRSLQVMVVINDTHKRSDSVHHFSVKLSLFMCMLAACSGSPPQCSTFSSNRCLWLSGCHGSVTEYWQLKPEVSWVQLPATAGLFTFLCFHLITSKFLYMHYQFLATYVLVPKICDDIYIYISYFPEQFDWFNMSIHLTV